MGFGIADEKEACVIGNMRPLVQVEGDRLRALDACEKRAQSIGESGERAECAIDVEPQLLSFTDVGNLLLARFSGLHRTFPAICSVEHRQRGRLLDKLFFLLKGSQSCNPQSIAIRPLPDENNSTLGLSAWALGALLVSGMAAGAGGTLSEMLKCATSRTALPA